MCMCLSLRFSNQSLQIGPFASKQCLLLKILSVLQNFPFMSLMVALQSGLQLLSKSTVLRNKSWVTIIYESWPVTTSRDWDHPDQHFFLLLKKRETAEDKGHRLASDSQENPNSPPGCLIHSISFSSHISSIYTKFSFSLLFSYLLCMNQFFHYTISQKSLGR